MPLNEFSATIPKPGTLANACTSHGTRLFDRLPLADWRTSAGCEQYAAKFLTLGGGARAPSYRPKDPHQHARGGAEARAEAFRAPLSRHGSIEGLDGPRAIQPPRLAGRTGRANGRHPMSRGAFPRQRPTNLGQPARASPVEDETRAPRFFRTNDAADFEEPAASSAGGAAARVSSRPTQARVPRRA